MHMLTLARASLVSLLFFMSAGCESITDPVTEESRKQEEISEPRVINLLIQEIVIPPDPNAKSAVDYGADPTGEHDSWEALQKLLDEQSTAWIECGAYRLSRPLRVGEVHHEQTIVSTGCGQFHARFFRDENSGEATVLVSEKSHVLRLIGITAWADPKKWGTDRSPLVWLKRPYWTFIQDSYFFGGPGDGLYIGGVDGTLAGSKLYLYKSWARENRGKGIALDRYVDFILFAGGSEYNRGGGLYISPPRDRIMNSGVVMGWRFEGNNEYSAYLDEAFNIVMQNNFVYSSDIVLGSCARDNVVAYNFFLDAKIREECSHTSTNNTIGRNFKSWEGKPRLIIPVGKTAEMNFGDGGGDLCWWSMPGGNLVLNGEEQTRRNDLDPLTNKIFIWPHCVRVPGGISKLHAKGTDVWVLETKNEKK